MTSPNSIFPDATFILASRSGQVMLIFVLTGLIFFGIPKVGLKRAAWIKIVIGFLLAVGAMRFFPHTQAGTKDYDRLYLWWIALPLVYASTGVIELITNKPFAKEARRFDSLNKDQQIAAGFWAVVITVGLAFIAGYIYIQFR
jgi:hypothetical protein